MAKIMLAWEMGGGLGHLLPLQPIAEQLSRSGHDVSVVVRDICGAGNVFANMNVSLFQSPMKPALGNQEIQIPITFPHVLHNAGFWDDEVLRSVTGAWQSLYRSLKPDMIIFDSSPVALLASRSIDTKRVLVGTGFFCPPDVYPLPTLRTWAASDATALRLDEDRILFRVNRLLSSWSRQPLGRIAQLFSEVDCSLLATVPELDHYPERRSGDYLGVWTRSAGKSVEWPTGSGPKIFAYLKAIPSLPGLLKVLGAGDQRVILYSPGASERLDGSSESPSLRLVEEPVNLGEIAQQCDVAVLNATNGTTLSMLLAGKPLLQLPIFLEQAICARTVRRLGLGLDADHSQPRQVAERLKYLISSDECRRSAQAFAEKYSWMNQKKQLELVMTKIEGALK